MTRIFKTTIVQEKENSRYREMCAEAAFKEMDLSNNLLNQLMPPHIHKAVRVGRPYGESCEVCKFVCLCVCVFVWLNLDAFITLYISMRSYRLTDQYLHPCREFFVTWIMSKIFDI